MTKQLIVAVFGSVETARQAANDFEALSDKHEGFHVDNGVVVEKDANGKLAVLDAESRPFKGGLIGAIAGGLLGMLAGPLGAITGMAAGAGGAASSRTQPAMRCSTASSSNRSRHGSRPAALPSSSRRTRRHRSRSTISSRDSAGKSCAT